ncbi:MAG: DUF3306 domain-containing protein [Hyphomicrobiaceae bacterium]
MPENPTTPPDDPERGSSFFKRWSDRKANATVQPAEPAPETAAEAAEPPVEHDAAAAEEAPPPITEADLEGLTYESDYTKFLGEQVPDALRRRALRQLWRSDPILANLDGLCDYDDDFTDAALVVKVLETAHKVGQGYLTDEEVAANQARGTPPPAAEEADESVEDDSEDIDDTDDAADEEAVAAAETDDARAEDATAPESKQG